MFSNGFKEEEEPLIVTSTSSESILPAKQQPPSSSSNTSLQQMRSLSQSPPLIFTSSTRKPVPPPSASSSSTVFDKPVEQTARGRQTQEFEQVSRSPLASGSRSKHGSHSLVSSAVDGSSPFAVPPSSRPVAFAAYSSSSSSIPSTPSSRQPHPGADIATRIGGQPHGSYPQSGRIPIISSGSSARLPSAYLPTSGNAAASSSTDYYRLQSASVSAENNLALSTRAGLMAPASAPRRKSSPGIIVAAGGMGKTNEVIDLTLSEGEDSSDDVIVDDTPLCIGQITSLALVMYPVSEVQPMPLQRSITHDALGNPFPPSSLPEPLPQLPLSVHILRGSSQNGNETLKLLTPISQEVFGVMEHKVANVLGPLLGNGYAGTGVQVGSYGGNGKVWCEASVVRKGEVNPMMMPLHLLLFARPIHIPEISHLLDVATVYLEHPPAYNPALHNGYRYSNPHNPAAGVSGARGDAERRRMQMSGGIFNGAVRVAKTVEVQREQVEFVFKNLASGVDVEEHEPPPMIRTRLYSHQKQALSFLLDRERLIPVLPVQKGIPDTTTVSLWQRKLDIYGRVVGWINLVTDLEIAGDVPPPQCRGAILADDMGVGKTIVVISLVATTLDEAREWAKEAPVRDVIDARFETDATEKAKAGGVSLADFGSALPAGIGANGASSAKALSKKKEAKLARDKKRSDVQSSRFARLVTRSRATLIICPLSTVQNWESQFEEHVGQSMDSWGKEYKVKIDEEPVGMEEEESSGTRKGKGKMRAKLNALEEEEERSSQLSVYVYHGNSRTSDPLQLANYDVVITTFSTLGTEFSKQNRAIEEQAGTSLSNQDAAESSDEALEFYGPDGTLLDGPKPALGKKVKRKRKRVEGTGASPLQSIEWFRVVLDEAHIIKEHTTIQARAACDLAAVRRIALSGTPLQNSLNDLFSLVRFLRLEPFPDRAVWTQHIGSLAKSGDPLGVSRLQLIMRHLALRRTKASLDKNGKPILSLPPNNQTLVSLTFDPAEHAFYKSHHTRYKHDFAQLEASDSVMKNYCSILQELLRLRQICVHTALVKDSEDNAQGDLIKTIESHGISKPRAIQLLSLLRDAGGAQCSECGLDLLSVGTSVFRDQGIDVEEKKPAKKGRKIAKSTSTSAVCSEDDSRTTSSGIDSIITRCQHVFCRLCFQSKVCANWPDAIVADEKAICRVCRTEITPALDAVCIGSTELEKALENATDGEQAPNPGRKGKKVSRLFEHSTKTKALLADVFPFSQANPASKNFWGEMDQQEPKTESSGGTIGFQPIKGEVVKSVVFSQWTKLLDRLGDALDSQSIKFGRLDGAMNREQRTVAMDTFKLDPASEILLVSLRAGGVGLNLTAGRRVYLMEPFWNPAVEISSSHSQQIVSRLTLVFPLYAQACDRVHRLGQTKPVQTTRFIIEHSIEENMLKIQKRKTDLANMSLTQTLSKADLQKRAREDLHTLME